MVKTPNSFEIFHLPPLVDDQHQAKGYAKVKFSENAITL